MRSMFIAEHDVLLVYTMFDLSFLNQVHGTIMVRLLLCESICCLYCKLLYTIDAGPGIHVKLPLANNANLSSNQLLVGTLC